MLVRTPIRRQLGVIPIDEFDGEFLGIAVCRYVLSLSAVGRLLSVGRVWYHDSARVCGFYRENTGRGGIRLSVSPTN